MHVLYWLMIAVQLVSCHLATHKQYFLVLWFSSLDEA